MNIADITITEVIVMVFMIVFVYTGIEMIYNNRKRDRDETDNNSEV